MPRKLRRPKRRRTSDELKPFVVDFLETGRIDIPPSENPWIVMELLSDRAQKARQAWERGDRDAAIALLNAEVQVFFVGG